MGGQQTLAREANQPEHPSPGASRDEPLEMSGELARVSSVGLWNGRASAQGLLTLRGMGSSTQRCTGAPPQPCAHPPHHTHRRQIQRHLHRSSKDIGAQR